MKKINKKIIFFVGIFPVISESWLVEQIIDLLGRGIDLRIVVFKKGDSVISEKIKKYAIMDRVTYINFPENVFARTILAVPLFFRSLFLRPSLLLRLFNIRKYGRETLSLKYLFWTAPIINLITENDIVHCHFGMISNKYLVIKELLGLRNAPITSFYGLDASKYIKVRGREYYNRLIKEGSWFFPNNSFMREHLIASGFPADKTIVMHNPILPGSFTYREKKFQTGEVFKIIFAGRFVEKKGLEDLLRAVQIVHQKYEKIELHIVGAGKDETYERKIKGLVDDLGMNSIVIFHGMLDHKKLGELYQDMHVMALLSKVASDGDSEGLPYVLLEAQASGLPVVSTYHAGISDAVLDGESGFLVGEGDYRVAAEKISSFIENPELVSSFGRRGHEYVLEKFDVAKINDKLEGFYYSNNLI